MQHMKLRPSGVAVVAAAFHGYRKLVRPAERADEQRHQNGDQRSRPLEQISALKIRSAGLLSRHDLIRLLNEHMQNQDTERYLISR